MSEFSSIVLAAGEGTRLQPLTYHRPKPMLPVVTRPILEHVFDELVEAGVSEITVVVGYHRNRVQSHFGPTYRDVPLTYVQQQRQLGTGHAVLATESTCDCPCLVVNGDQIVDQQIVRDVVDEHSSNDAVATLGVLRRSDVSDYGGVLLDGTRVTEIVENPRDDREYWLNLGVYMFESPVFDAVRETTPRTGEHSLVDAITNLIERGATVRAVESRGMWVDATYPWDLLQIAEKLIEHRGGGSRDVDGIAPSATVHDSAIVRDPVVVSADCEIGAGAVIGPNACLSENVTIGSNSVVERSLLDADVRVGQNATLVDSVLGRGVHLGAGTTIPGGPGDVRVGNRVHEGERLGALLADHVRDEGGTTYAPGTVVGAETKIHAGATVRGTIRSDTEVRS